MYSEFKARPEMGRGTLFPVQRKQIHHRLGQSFPARPAHFLGEHLIQLLLENLLAAAAVEVLGLAHGLPHRLEHLAVEGLAHDRLESRLELLLIGLRLGIGGPGIGASDAVGGHFGVSAWMDIGRFFVWGSGFSLPWILWAPRVAGSRPKPGLPRPLLDNQLGVELAVVF